MSLRSFHLKTILARALVVALLTSLTAVGEDGQVTKDIVYAKAGADELKLDLYRPPGAAKTDRSPLIVWVHGGAWRAGSKKEMPLGALVKQGYAVASIDYRLSPVAPFPAQVHDIKAAIRFLRAKGAQLGLRTERIAIAGASAGGHLAALVGVTNRVKELEGDVGEDADQSSDVHAIVSLYGASNLQSILSQSTPHGLSVRIPALELLLGGQPEAKPELARQASPVAYVEPSDPPLLLIHGDQDPQMPINQSHELAEIYESSKLPVRFQVVHGGKHGGPEFYDDLRISLIAGFLREYFATP